MYLIIVESWSKEGKLIEYAQAWELFQCDLAVSYSCIVCQKSVKEKLMHPKLFDQLDFVAVSVGQLTTYCRFSVSWPLLIK